MTRTEWRRKWEFAMRAMAREMSQKQTLPAVMVGVPFGGDPDECGIWWVSTLEPAEVIDVLKSAMSAIRKEHGLT